MERQNGFNVFNPYQYYYQPPTEPTERHEQSAVVPTREVNPFPENANPQQLMNELAQRTLMLMRHHMAMFIQQTYQMMQQFEAMSLQQQQGVQATDEPLSPTEPTEEHDPSILTIHPLLTVEIPFGEPQTPGGHVMSPIGASHQEPDLELSPPTTPSSTSVSDDSQPDSPDSSN